MLSPDYDAREGQRKRVQEDMVDVLKLVGLAQKRRVMLENEGDSRNSEGIELKTLSQISELLKPNLVVGKSFMSSMAYLFI